MVEFHLLTLSATGARIEVLVFTRIEVTTSVLVDVRGYLLDHSDDECNSKLKESGAQLPGSR